MLDCLYDGKKIFVFSVCVCVCHVSAVIIVNVLELLLMLFVCFLEAHIAFVNVMDVYVVLSPCISRSLLPPQQPAERGLVSVNLLSLSLFSLFLRRQGDLRGLVWYRGNNKENNFILKYLRCH